MKINGPLSFSLGLIAAALCWLDTAQAQTNTLVATPHAAGGTVPDGVAAAPPEVRS